MHCDRSYPAPDHIAPRSITDHPSAAPIRPYHPPCMLTKRLPASCAVTFLAVLFGACAEESMPSVPDSGAGGGGVDQPPWFREIAAEAGVEFWHDSDAAGGEWRFPEIMGGGVALIDIESDGDLDIYFVQSGKLDSPSADAPANALYRNDGGGHFTDISAGSGTDDRGYGMGVASGDLDNDGLEDLYVTNVGPNVLLRNRGDGTFEDITAAAGVECPAWSSSAATFDMDGDGDLDLFVCNYVRWSLQSEIDCITAVGRPDYCSPNSYQAPLPDTLYRNEGGGRFTDVSASAGILAHPGNGLGVAVGDFDGDFDLDVFVANDQVENHLWDNNGDGTFTEIGMRVGTAVDQQGAPKAGMGTLTEDFDGDDDLDLLVVNLRAQSDSFFRNEGAVFFDDTAAIGLGNASRPFTRFGVGFLDFDNDGWRDLYEASGRVTLVAERTSRSDDPFAEPNLLLAGGPDARFHLVAPEGGVETPLVHTSRAAAFGDLDNDGGIDIVVVNRDERAYVLRNVVPARGHWIRLRVLDEHNRAALGAELRVDCGERTLRRDVKSNYSYCAANDPRVHVGLGAITKVAQVRVRWRNGHEEAFGPFDVDREFTLRLGGGTSR